jgi:hypothetical protein
MVFNLSRSRCYPCLSPAHAICRSETDGPVFGYDELFFAQASLNSERMCHSDPFGSVYSIGVDHEGKNKLTNSKDECLTISEFEVWEVYEMQPYKKE